MMKTLINSCHLSKSCFSNQNLINLLTNRNFVSLSGLDELGELEAKLSAVYNKLTAKESSKKKKKRKRHSSNSSDSSSSTAR